MTTITLSVPDALEKEHDETVRLIAVKLYEAHKLTLGQAAEMCGMKKWDFAEILINYGVYYLDASATADLNEFKKSSRK
jgi:predicted HTH domain antitoxin